MRIHAVNGLGGFANLAAVPRRRLYCALGALLSLGAPIGLCLSRAAQVRLLSFSWLRAELANDLPTYLYVFLSTLVAFSAFGFSLGRHADRLIDLSTTDTLTGLHNRRALYERLTDEIARARRYAQPLSLLMIDVDRLKEINDGEGHRAGDVALQQVAAAVRSGSRSVDLGARWGGDEFAILAPNTGAAAAAGLAERVRLLLEGHTKRTKRAPVTVSVGIATVDPAGLPLTPEAFVLRADEALYAAKRGGRNRIAEAGPGWKAAP